MKHLKEELNIEQFYAEQMNRPDIIEAIEKARDMIFAFTCANNGITEEEMEQIILAEYAHEIKNLINNC